MHTLPCETLLSAKQAINDKLQGSVATYLEVRWPQNFGHESVYSPTFLVHPESVPIQYWHSAGSLCWRPFPMLKYKYIFRIKYTEAILSDSTRKLLWIEITKMLMQF